MNKLLSFEPKEPYMVDWSVVGVENIPENVSKQYNTFKLNLDNNTLQINSSIDIPCYVAHTFNIPKGSFYRFEGVSEYELTNIDVDIISDLIIEHFNKLDNIIQQDVISKSQGQREYIVVHLTKEQIDTAVKNFLGSL